MFSLAAATSFTSFAPNFVSCALGWSEYTKFLVTALVPLLALCLPALVIGVISARHNFKERLRLTRCGECVVVVRCGLLTTPAIELV